MPSKFILPLSCSKAEHWLGNKKISNYRRKGTNVEHLACKKCEPKLGKESYRPQ